MTFEKTPEGSEGGSPVSIPRRGIGSQCKGLRQEERSGCTRVAVAHRKGRGIGAQSTKVAYQVISRLFAACCCHCMYVHTCACGCLCVAHTHMWAPMWRPEEELEFLPATFCLFALRKCLSLNWKLPIFAGHPALEICLFLPANAFVTGVQSHGQDFTQVVEILTQLLIL